jgi:hypothetical protein
MCVIMLKPCNFLGFDDILCVGIENACVRSVGNL